MGPSEWLRACVLASTVAIAAVLGLAGTAVAQRCEAPPGTAGVEQYCETVPGAKGERGSRTEPGVGRALDRRTARRLERAGRDGRGILALPATGKRKRERVERGPEPSESPLGAVGSAIESGASAGQGFVWVLVAAGLGMGGIAWVRYRSGSGP